MSRKKIQIPKDEEHVGHTDSACWAKLYGATEKEVRAKGDAWIKAWPDIYSPSWRVRPTKHPDGYWYCVMGRYHSCD